MKTLIQNLTPYQALYRHSFTGIAWIEDDSTGMAHSCHPNIHTTGSVLGMIKLGYWQPSDHIVRSDGYFYNTSNFVISDELDNLAAINCLCHSCQMQH
ncbi:hypothetical protein [Myxosarcina sp. GI1]|uniref:hypothetical protein n=1 Tax=Myxosarcina sp. GI1 TaxID=1541065 RepID=UPI00055FC9F2|nr:hypothetical protein [Myxosarcina sp. GI1]